MKYERYKKFIFKMHSKPHLSKTWFVRISPASWKIAFMGIGVLISPLLLYSLCTDRDTYTLGRQVDTYRYTYTGTSTPHFHFYQRCIHSFEFIIHRILKVSHIFYILYFFIFFFVVIRSNYTVFIFLRRLCVCLVVNTSNYLDFGSLYDFKTKWM